MVALPFTPLLVTLGKCFFTNVADAFTVPKRRGKVYPLLVAVGAFRAGEQLVHPREGLVGQRNEIVLQRHNGFHVKAILAAIKFELLSNCFHRSILLQLNPVVQPIFGNFRPPCQS